MPKPKIEKTNPKETNSETISQISIENNSLMESDAKLDVLNSSKVQTGDLENNSSTQELKKLKLLENIRLFSQSNKDSLLNQINILENNILEKNPLLTSSFNTIRENIISLSNIIEERTNELIGIQRNASQNFNFFRYQERVITEKNQKLWASLKKVREEQGLLRGRTKLDKIHALISLIKDCFQTKNLDQENLEREGYNFNHLNERSKNLIRTQGIFVFQVDDAKMVQEWIIQCLKHFNLLIAGQIISYRDKMDIAYIRGLLTNLHLRFDFITNQVDTMVGRTLEIRRLFSALEIGITNFAHFDEQEQSVQEYDSVIRSFEHFNSDDKKRFVITAFESPMVESLADDVQNDILVRLLTEITLPPEEVLQQLSRWERSNQTYRPKFLSFLKVELTASERLNIAESDIKELKEMWKRTNTPTPTE